MATLEGKTSLVPGGCSGDAAISQESPLESFAAELALAAYRVALRTRTEGTWLDLELDLWRVLAAKVQDMGRGNCVGAANR
jgi:hypothetical protein